MNRSFIPVCMVFVSALLLMTPSAHAIKVDGLDYMDLSHYSEESLHREAVYYSKDRSIIVITYAADNKGGEEFARMAARHAEGGARIRAVWRGAPQEGRSWDIYYDGISLVRAGNKPYPPLDTFEANLASIIQLQASEIRLAEKEKEISDLTRRIDAFREAEALARDPDINK